MINEHEGLGWNGFNLMEHKDTKTFKGKTFVSLCLVYLLAISVSSVQSVFEQTISCFS